MKEEFGIVVTVDEYIGESIYHYDHGTIQLLAYRARWEYGQIALNDHVDFRWVSSKQLAEYDFAPADLPFVEKFLHEDK